MKRASGVLMHISSLFGDYSIGSFGESAKYFIDFLKDSGFSYWQVLPFCYPDDYNSPYKSYSAFGGNPYFIDLKLTLPTGTDIKVNDKVIDCDTGYEYEAEVPRNIRGHHITVQIHRVHPKAI